MDGMMVANNGMLGGALITLIELVVMITLIVINDIS